MMASRRQIARPGDVIVREVKGETAELSFISLPKLEGLFDSSIRETISMGFKFSIGDLIFFHGWKGRPYQSDWSYRTRSFRITEVYNVYITVNGITWVGGTGTRTPDWDLVPWGDSRIDHIAKLDEIVPPTDGGYRAQILRWVPIESHPPWRSP
ncbi:MAG: hypothetical protein JRC90_10770 [Deltaproteobacteria bacterium]|nr:hypothetical protein [Deltaproteobacteria bacterium]